MSPAHDPACPSGQQAGCPSSHGRTVASVVFSGHASARCTAAARLRAHQRPPERACGDLGVVGRHCVYQGDLASMALVSQMVAASDVTA